MMSDDVLDLLYDFFVCHNSQILVYSFITVFALMLQSKQKFPKNESNPSQIKHHAVSERLRLYQIRRPLREFSR